MPVPAPDKGSSERRTRCGGATEPDKRAYATSAILNSTGLSALVNLGHLQTGRSGAGPWPAGGLSGRLAASPSKAAGGLRGRRSAKRCPTISFEVSDIKAEPWLVSAVSELPTLQAYGASPSLTD